MKRFDVTIHRNNKIMSMDIQKSICAYFDLSIKDVDVDTVD